MKRKGFLASLLGLAAAPMLGKVKPKPKFPRWFVWIPPGGFPGQDCFCVSATNVVCVLSRTGKSRRLHRHKPLNRRDGNGHQVLAYDDGPTTLSDMVEGVARGFFREITAAEAKALLKTASSANTEPALRDPHWFLYGVECPVCQKKELVSLRDRDSNTICSVQCAECGTVFPLPLLDKYLLQHRKGQHADTFVCRGVIATHDAPDGWKPAYT